MDNTEYIINCVAMAIVNFTNETNGVDVFTRQANNDKCFNFAVEKIKESQFIAVRCKDCVHSNKIRRVGNGTTEPPYITIYRCDISELGMQEDDFCSYGELK